MAEIPSGRGCGCGGGWQLQLQLDPPAWGLPYATGTTLRSKTTTINKQTKKTTTKTKCACSTIAKICCSADDQMQVHDGNLATRSLPGKVLLKITWYCVLPAVFPFKSCCVQDNVQKTVYRAALPSCMCQLIPHTTSLL